MAWKLLIISGSYILLWLWTTTTLGRVIQSENARDFELLRACYPMRRMRNKTVTFYDIA